MTQYIIKYRGVLTEMYVTGFSEPMRTDDDSLERSVQASNLIADAKVFDESEVDETLALTLRCQPSAERIQL